MAKRADGEGGLGQRKDGRWYASLRYIDPETGEPRRTTVYGNNKTEARRKLAEVKKRVQQNKPVRDTKTTVGDWLKDWRGPSGTLTASKRAQNTKDTYASLCRVHLEPALGTIPLDRLQPRHVTQMLAELRAADLSDSTIKQIYTVLRKALDDAIAAQKLAYNVCAAVPRPTAESPEAQCLSAEEVRALLRAAEKSRFHDVIAFIAATGVRRGEALATKWSHIDLEKKRYRVPGTKTRASKRRIPLKDETVFMLEVHKDMQALEAERAGDQWQDSGLVFTTERGMPIDGRNVLRAVKSAAKRAGLGDICVHTLRHSVATMMMESGVPDRVIAQTLGHSDTSITTNTYQHVRDSELVKAMDKMPDILDA